MTQAFEPSGSPTGVVARVLGDDGAFSAPTRVSWKSGRFVLDSITSTGSVISEDSGLITSTGSVISELVEDFWLIPGLVDAHLHAGWHAFTADERDEATDAERQEFSRIALTRTLAAGVTSVRDAGGLAPETTQSLPPHRAPRVQHALTMIDRAAAEVAGGIGKAAEAALLRGARWIKLIGTASVSAPLDADLEPVFSREEVREAVRVAQDADAGVMMHAWGGEAIDDGIEAGVTSIEHGMYLTRAQAERAAERGLTFVPTLRIYRLVQQMIDDGQLPAAFRRRVADAVSHHPEAVRIARDAGLPIALGSDYGTMAQHGTNRLEFDVLVECGLSTQEALIAATRSGAELLRQAVPADERDSWPSGRIADGEVADAVLLRRDPTVPGALAQTDVIHTVIRGGIAITPEDAEPTP